MGCVNNTLLPNSSAPLFSPFTNHFPTSLLYVYPCSTVDLWNSSVMHGKRIEHTHTCTHTRAHTSQAALVGHAHPTLVVIPDHCDLSRTACPMALHGVGGRWVLFVLHIVVTGTQVLCAERREIHRMTKHNAQYAISFPQFSSIRSADDECISF